MTYTAEVLADGPALYWDMHLPNPNQHLCPDLSGNNLGGDVFYVVRAQPGAILSDPANTCFGFTRNGQAQHVQSNGLEGSGYATPTVLNIIDQDFTIECWVKPTGSHDYYGVWEIGSGAANQYLSLHSSNVPGKLYLHTWTSTDHVNGIPVTWDAWNHVVVVYDNTAHTVTCYLNGNPTPAYSRSYTLDLSQTPNSFIAGSLDGRYWLGCIDEVAIYRGKLSTARMAAHYAAAFATTRRSVTFDPPARVSMAAMSGVAYR